MNDPVASIADDRARGVPGPDAGRGGSLRLFLVLAFGVPWLGWTLLALLKPDPEGALARVLFFSGNACSLAGLVAAWSSGGRAALGRLLRRCVRLRAPPTWWLLALLLPVVIQLVALFSWGMAHGAVGELAPAGLAALFAPLALLAFLTGPLGEELGWRGFLLPRLLERMTPLRASVALGLLWTLWHLPLYYDSIFSDGWMALLFTVDLVCTSLLMTAMHQASGGSVLLAMVLHWTANVAPGVAAVALPGVEPGDTPGFHALGVAGLVLATLWVLARSGALRRGARSADIRVT
ncbi:hypothetical protein DRQ32_10465 [bacterium]|nr:MAG: hypothetical protein DRQ32_10465 [bacterium]